MGKRITIVVILRGLIYLKRIWAEDGHGWWWTK